MKSVLAVLLFIAIAVAFVSAQTRFDIERSDTEVMFQEWQDYHMKSYSSAAEAELRYFNFLGQIQRAKDLNEKFNSTNYGVTMFSDMTTEEFRAKYLMDTSKLGPMPVSPFTDFVKKPPARPITNTNGESAGVGGYAPNQHYDWKFNIPGVVTPVYNQAQCGSCWAWSAMEQIESDHSLQHGIDATVLTATGIYPLSTQQIVDCDTDSYGCNGGWTQRAYGYVISAGGLETNGQYPYRAQTMSCNANGPKVVSISAWNGVGGGTDDGLYGALQQGPVSVCLDASNFNNYNGGIVMANECGTSVDHCIQLTGWYTDGNGNPNVWSLRNQWGSGWGEQGYIRFQYGANTCAINSGPTQVNAN